MNTATPMFEQYLSLKASHPGFLLLYRMGDFYELFFDDAIAASKALELTLTARNKSDPDPVPMAGFPHHQLAPYTEQLLAAGYKVAIADQLEDPALAKGLVKRGITRVVTPGMVLDPTTLDRATHNWLIAVCAEGGAGWGLAALDASTGDLRCTTLRTAEAAAAELARYEPREALVGPGVGEGLDEALRGVTRSETLAEAWTAGEASAILRETLGAAPAVFGVEPGPALRACGAVLRYAAALLGRPLTNVHRLTSYAASGSLVIDATTRRNLELFRSLLHGSRSGTVFQLIDRCETAMGSRLLKDWLGAPLLDPRAIGARQAAVAELVALPDCRAALRRALGTVADLDRLAARIAQGLGAPRDLAAIRRSLGALPALVRAVADAAAVAPHAPRDLLPDILDDLTVWLADDPPIALGDGGVIAPGADPELDRLQAIAVDAIGVLHRLEADEIRASGIASLKIRRNRNFGFYIEITKANLHKVPDRYLRRQTLTTGERFITPELKALEEEVLGADERRLRLEATLFTALRERVAAASPRLAQLARDLATLDALAALAEVAHVHRWVRPSIDDSLDLELVGARHPVVEAALTDERFVPNDVTLAVGRRQLIVLTGPNMAGKSTVLRQVALIVLLAQMGSFVPVEQARIGVCDRVFTRVGAADDLARGQSTFMVEMAETAAILHQATERSLVVLDEIGRGTSTYDGLAIAWSVAEDLVDRIRCRALFATHYHELCELADARAVVVNQSVAVSASGDRILFLRRLKEGGASRSYGIQCARLAGLPAGVVARAGRLLTRFEKHAARNEAGQLSLFGAVPTQDEPPAPVDPVRTALAEINPDALSPRDAHAALYALRALL